jgi:hypothetical protein
VRLAALVLAALLPAAAAGQTLRERVGSVEGEVAFRYAVRPGVVMCERGMIGRTTRGDGCVEGLAEVSVVRRAGRIERLDVEAPASDPRTLDLGVVAPAEAAELLLSLAALPAAQVAAEAAVAAVMGAAIADGIEVWPDLLALGRDPERDPELRRAALFWVSQAAAEVVTRGLVEVAGDERDDESVRQAAVFALSRRPPDQAVPSLIDVAQTAPGKEVRRSALFWLARIDDPRVVSFFERVLLGG